MAYSNYQQSDSIDSHGHSGLFYLLLGGGIGAALALLFAPKSGAELRTDISDLTRKGYEETVDLAHQLREQSSEVLNSVKEKTGKVYDLAAAKWAHLADVAEGTSDIAADVINGEIKALEEKSSRTRTAVRKSLDVH